MGQFTTGVLASTAPWTSSNAAWQANIEALCAMFEPVAQLVMDSGSPDDPASYVAGWSTLLNLDTCPAQYLPYLGMMLGIYIAPGTGQSAAQAIINTKAGWKRGSGYGGTYTSATGAAGGAIVGLLESAMTGNQQVTLAERTNGTSTDAYQFVLIAPTSSLVYNYVPDPGFEYDTPSAAPSSSLWAASSPPTASTFQVETSWSATGSKSLRGTWTTTASAQQPCFLSGSGTSGFLVQGGSTYTAQATLNVITNTCAGSTNCFFIRWYDTSGSNISSSSTVYTTIPTGISTLSITATAPSNAVYASLQIGVQSSASGQVFDAYLDDVIVQLGSSIAGYVDGDSGGIYGWSSTPGASPTWCEPGIATAVNAVKPAGVFWNLTESSSVNALEDAATAASGSTGGTLAWTISSGPEATMFVYGTSSPSTATTKYALFTNFGFQIPSGATIAGIQAVVRRSGSSGSLAVTDASILLIKAGTIQSVGDHSTGATWAAYPGGTQPYGGPNDLWSGTWTPSDINNSGFGLAVEANVSISVYGGGSPQIADVQIFVSYHF